MSMTFPTAILLIISVVTNITVEAIKKILNNGDTKYSSNLLAVIVAIVMAIAVCGTYLVMNGIAFTTKVVVEMLIMTYGSFLVATVGYDKVMQMINQLKIIK